MQDFTLANGVISYCPIFVSEDTTFTRIAVNVSNLQAGQTLDLRIFEWKDGLPGALVLDAGSVSLAAVAIVAIVISQLLARGYYFLANRTTAGAGAKILGINGSANLTIPVPGITGVISTQMLYCTMSVTAAWADPAPTPTAIVSEKAATMFLREN